MRYIIQPLNWTVEVLTEDSLMRSRVVDYLLNSASSLEAHCTESAEMNVLERWKTEDVVKSVFVVASKNITSFL